MCTRVHLKKTRYDFYLHSENVSKSYIKFNYENDLQILNHMDSFECDNELLFLLFPFCIRNKSSFSQI